METLKWFCCFLKFWLRLHCAYGQDENNWYLNIFDPFSVCLLTFISHWFLVSELYSFLHINTLHILLDVFLKIQSCVVVLNVTVFLLVIYKCLLLVYRKAIFFHMLSLHTMFWLLVSNNIAVIIWNFLHEQLCQVETITLYFGFSNLINFNFLFFSNRISVDVLYKVELISL